MDRVKQAKNERRLITSGLTQAGGGLLLTPKRWVEMTNAKSINALLIRQGLPQGERLVQLNSTSIMQMRSLAAMRDSACGQRQKIRLKTMCKLTNKKNGNNEFF